MLNSGLFTKLLSLRISRISSLIIFVGFILRYAVATFGHNFDFQSYVIVANAVNSGNSPWSTGRYNYGLPWAILISCFERISFGNMLAFRFLIVTTLTVADLVIAYFIYRWAGKWYSYLFFLNPISVIISGYYNQFDNIAICFGLVGVSLLDRQEDNKRFRLGLVALALSLSVKHNLVLFLLWLAFKERNRWRSIALVVVPSSLFMLQFLPFMFKAESRNSVLSGVFKYWSSNNAPFWKFFVPNKVFAESLSDFNSWHHGRLWMVLFLISMTVTGWILKSEPYNRSIFLYTIFLLIFSSAITSQFFAIAAVGACALFNWGFILFLSLGALWLVGEPSGLDIQRITELFNQVGIHGWTLPPSLLIIGVSVYFYQRNRTKSPKNSSIFG